MRNLLFPTRDAAYNAVICYMGSCVELRINVLTINYWRIRQETATCWRVIAPQKSQADFAAFIRMNMHVSGTVSYSTVDVDLYA